MVLFCFDECVHQRDVVSGKKDDVEYVRGREHTGWQRPIGCLNLQVNFRKKAINYRALLRKITYKDKASYGSSPPCSAVMTNV